MYYLCMMMVFLGFLHPDINVVGDYQKEEMMYVYGNYKEKGYLLAYHRENENIHFEITYDRYDENYFSYLADIGDYFLVINRYVKDNDHRYQVLQYDGNGRLIDEQLLDLEIQGFYNHHHHLVIVTNDTTYYMNDGLELKLEIEPSSILTSTTFQYQGVLYLNDLEIHQPVSEPGIYHYKIIDNDYAYTFEIGIEPDITIEGEPYNDGYHDKVKISANVPIRHDGSLYEDPLILSRVGNHQIELVIYGGVQTMNISIYPTIYVYQGKDGQVLENNDYFFQAIYLYSDANQLFLNGRVYEGDIIWETGYYVLEIWGEKKRMETKDFSIKPQVDGLINNTQYKQVNFYVFGEAYLNGQAVNGLVNCQQPGDYQLDVYFEEELYERISFKIMGDTGANQSHDLTYILGCVFIVSCLYIWLKK